MGPDVDSLCQQTYPGLVYNNLTKHLCEDMIRIGIDKLMIFFKKG